MLLSGFIAKDLVVSNNYYLNIFIKQGRSIVHARTETNGLKLQALFGFVILLYLSEALLL